MKRFYIALILLSSIISVCFYSLFLYTNTHHEMSALLNDIQAAALAGEDNSAVSKMCWDYMQIWATKEKKLMRFIRHPQLDEIGAITAELPYLATDNSYSHLLASIERIKSDLDKIGNAEVFNG